MKGENTQESRVRPIGRVLASSARMDDDEIQVNCSRCGKSIILRLADLHDKRMVYCVDCERMVQLRNWPRLVRDKYPGPWCPTYVSRRASIAGVTRSVNDVVVAFREQNHPID